MYCNLYPKKTTRKKYTTNVWRKKNAFYYCTLDIKRTEASIVLLGRRLMEFLKGSLCAFTQSQQAVIGKLIHALIITVLKKILRTANSHKN